MNWLIVNTLVDYTIECAKPALVPRGAWVDVCGRGLAVAKRVILLAYPPDALAIVDQYLTCKVRLAYHLGKYLLAYRK